MNDEVFKALADPTRRKILRMLGDGDLTAGELGSHFDMSGPSMSHHFSVLKGAGLITGKRDGQQIIYSVNTTVLQDVLALVLDMTNTKRGSK